MRRSKEARSFSIEVRKSLAAEDLHWQWDDLLLVLQLEEEQALEGGLDLLALLAARLGHLDEHAADEGGDEEEGECLVELVHSEVVGWCWLVG